MLEGRRTYIKQRGHSGGKRCRLVSAFLSRVVVSWLKIHVYYKNSLFAQFRDDEITWPSTYSRIAVVQMERQRRRRHTYRRLGPVLAGEIVPRLQCSV